MGDDQVVLVNVPLLHRVSKDQRKAGNLAVISPAAGQVSDLGESRNAADVQFQIG